MAVQSVISQQPLGNAMSEMSETPWNRLESPTESVEAPGGEPQEVPWNRLESPEAPGEELVVDVVDRTEPESPEVKKERETKNRIEVIRKSFTAPSNWVLSAGTVLASCAAAVNTITFLSLGSYVSHVTGTLTRVGMRLEGVVLNDKNTPLELGQTVLLIMSFVVGSFFCGFLISKNEVHLGKSLYGVALICNSLLLVGAIIVNELYTPNPGDIPVPCYLAAMACGLQNGMCTMHFGAVVRTTHVTGLLTDFGLTLGRSAFIMIRKGCILSRVDELDREELAVDGKKLRVFVSLGAGFVCGVVLGSFLQQHWHFRALLVPAFITFVSGVAYSVVQQRLKSAFQSLEVNRLNHDVEEVEHILQRARNFLSLAKKQNNPSNHSVPEDLDGQMEHALEVLHDVEANIHDVFDTQSCYSFSSQRSPRSPSFVQPRSPSVVHASSQRSPRSPSVHLV